jgi:hypothetical protein
MQEAKLQKVLRIQYVRGLKSHLIAGKKYRLRVIVASEFADASPGVVERYTFRITFIYTDASNAISPINVSVTQECKDDVAYLTFACPQHVGIVSVRVDCYLAEDNNGLSGPTGATYIMPIVTENVHIFEGTLVDEAIRSSTPVQTSVILSCVRHLEEEHVEIEEEYGSTLGAHIYDSSIVLYRYLVKSLTGEPLNSHAFYSLPEARRTVVELGSGCGMLGIALSTYFEKVYVTDKRVQMPLLRSNVERNHASKICIPYELDWSDAARLAELRNRCNGCIDLILAADVFYDPTVAGSLLAAIDTLRNKKGKAIVENDTDRQQQSEEAEDTAIIVAQKLRGKDEADGRYDISNVPGIDATCIHEEADVRLWSLRYD